MDEFFELDEHTQAMFEAIGAAVEQEESEPHVLNIPRVLQMTCAFRQIKRIAWPDWQISCSMHEPYTSMGVISIEASEFTFESMTILSQILIAASNVEIYPLTNGNLRMNITFHGITKRM